MSCSLCELVDAPRNNPLLIAEDDAAVIILSDDWAMRGHAVVVAREHVENVSQLSSLRAAAFFDSVRRTEEALLEVLEADRVFVMKLGLAVPHLHYHLYPAKQSATRADFLAAINMESRDEPPAEEQQRLLERLREKLASFSLQARTE